MSFRGAQSPLTKTRKTGLVFLEEFNILVGSPVQAEAAVHATIFLVYKNGVVACDESLKFSLHQSFTVPVENPPDIIIFHTGYHPR
jgi:hypothetical protein